MFEDCSVNIGPRQVAISSILLLAENILRLAAVAVISFWIARELGPEQFGILNFASALMAILLSVAALGMETPLILRLTQTRQPGALLGTALAIRTLFSLLVFMLSIGIIYFLKHDDALALQVALIVSLCVLAYVPNVMDCWFKARTLAMGPALTRTIATFVSVAAKALCLVLGFGVIALAWTVVLEALLAGIGIFIAYWWYSKSHPDCRLQISSALTSPLLHESLPYFWSSVAILLYMKVDVVMIGYLSTNSETGIYSLAQKLSEVLYMVPVVLIDSAYPALAKRFLDSEQRDDQSGQMLFDLAVGGALVATVLAIVLVGPFVTMAFGNAYQPAVDVFYLHAWSCIAIAMNTARHRWLAAVSLQRYAPIVTLIGLLSNVTLNIFLIPLMGAAGAAISTLVSYFLSGYLSSFMLAPLREIGMMQTRALWPWGRFLTTARSHMN